MPPAVHVHTIRRYIFSVLAHLKMSVRASGVNQTHWLPLKSSHNLENKLDHKPDTFLFSLVLKSKTLEFEFARWHHLQPLPEQFAGTQFMNVCRRRSFVFAVGCYDQNVNKLFHWLCSHVCLTLNHATLALTLCKDTQISLQIRGMNKWWPRQSMQR